MSEHNPLTAQELDAIDDLANRNAFVEPGPQMLELTAEIRRLESDKAKLLAALEKYGVGCSDELAGRILDCALKHCRAILTMLPGEHMNHGGISILRHEAKVRIADLIDQAAEAADDPRPEPTGAVSRDLRNCHTRHRWVQYNRSAGPCPACEAMMNS